ncbi:hypothetical protein PFISCL1PPCAC_18280, partial [Pristionchus fissidentatus]
SPISIGSSPTIPTMSAEYIETVVVKATAPHDLGITSFVDQPHWQLNVERHGTDAHVQALILSIKEPQPAIRKESKSFSEKGKEFLEKLSISSKSKGSRFVKVVNEAVERSRSIDTFEEPVYPVPYLVHISAKRTIKPVSGMKDSRFYSLPASPTGNETVEFGVWAFSGELRNPGDKFRVRVDAIVELMKEEGLAPHNYLLTVRVRTRRNLRIENLNTALTDVYLHSNKFERVSKEIMSLLSKQFDDVFYHRHDHRFGPNPGEDMKKFDEMMRLLIEFINAGKMDGFHFGNVAYLFELVKRFQFAGIYSRLGRVLMHVVSDPYLTRAQMDVVLQLADAHGLREATAYIIKDYRTFENTYGLYDRFKDSKISRGLLNQVFQRLLDLHERDVYSSACHLYFRTEAGDAIVQLNRAQLPKMVTQLIAFFAVPSRTGPLFHWDNKNQLFSPNRAAEELWTKEEAGKDSVPDGAWALILRREGEDRYRLLMVKERPTAHTIYVGHVVQGADLIDSGESVTKTGVHYLLD